MAITPGTDVNVEVEPLPRGPVLERAGTLSRTFSNWFQGKDRKLGEIISGVNLNRQNIVQLETDYQAADGTLSSAYIAADAVVFANSEASNATLSTNLTAAFQAADTTVTNAYIAADSVVASNASSALASATTSLTAAYQAADSTLQGQITTNAGNISTAQANITTLQSTTASNTGAISTLQTNLSAEVTNRTNADSTLQGQITTNSANITTLQSTTATNTSAISTLTTNLSAEVTNRTSADTALQGQITTNAGNITTNAAAITTEATARASGDAANATSITNLTATFGKTTKQLIADNFNNDGFYWTAGFGGAPESVADPADFTYTDVATIGRVAQLSTFNRYLQTKAAIKPYVGLKLRLEAKVRATVDPTSGQINVSLFTNGLSSSWVHGSATYSATAVPTYNSQENGLTVADGWITLAVFHTCTGISTHDAGWRPRLDLTHTGSGGTVQIAYFRIEDVTELQEYTDAQITTEASARASGDSANASLITTLEAKVDTKARTFVQTSAPSATATGDLWVDSDDDNKLYRWNGSSWVAVDDGRIATKSRTFAQNSAPTATATGDLWVDTDDDNKLYRWNGSSWVAVDDGRISTLSASVTNIAEAYATNDSATARLVWEVNTSTNVATIEQTAATGFSDGTWNGSAIKLSADLIELLAEDINFGTNTTYEDTYATLYTEKNSKRLRILGPFPAADDLVLWFGPTSVSLNSETKTNGHFCLATDGKIYLGSAELTNSGNLDFTYTNGFVKTRIGNGTNTSDSVSFTGSGGSGSGYTFAHELIVTYTTGPTVTLSNSTGSPITASATGVVGDEVRFFVQTTMTDSAGNKVTKSKGGGLFWDI